MSHALEQIPCLRGKVPCGQEVLLSDVDGLGLSDALHTRVHYQNDPDICQGYGKVGL
jgi:hypothetical protein